MLILIITCFGTSLASLESQSHAEAPLSNVGVYAFMCLLKKMWNMDPLTQSSGYQTVECQSHLERSLKQIAGPGPVT